LLKTGAGVTLFTGSLSDFRPTHNTNKIMSLPAQKEESYRKEAFLYV
jgi:hypothetical protein